MNKISVILGVSLLTVAGNLFATNQVAVVERFPKGGVGLLLSRADADDNGCTVVHRCLTNSSAERAHAICSGDRLLGVREDGATNFIDVRRLDLGEVCNLVKGNVGSKVELLFCTRTEDYEQSEFYTIELERYDVDFVGTNEVRGPISWGPPRTNAGLKGQVGSGVRVPQGNTGVRLKD